MQYVELHKEVLTTYLKQLLNHEEQLRRLGVDPEMLAAQVVLHDLSKLSPPEIEGYSLKYKGVINKKRIRSAAYHHYRNNPHHPEFWDETLSPKDFKVTFFGSVVPKKRVDATRMTPNALAEMVLDWCATAAAFGKDARKFAKRNIGRRWQFTPEQKKIIFELLSLAGC